MFLIWCSLCLLFICWASVEFVLVQTLLHCVLLFLSIFLEELVFFFFSRFFFFFLTNPFLQDLKLSDLLPIFVLLLVLSFLLDLIITSYRCIRQNSSKKLKQKKLFEPQKPVTVLRTVRSDHGSHGSLLFPHWAILEAKKTAKQRGSRFFQLDRTDRFGFQNLTNLVV